MEGDGQFAQAHRVFKDAGGWGSLDALLRCSHLLGYGGQRPSPKGSRPLVQALRSLVICAADCTEWPLALLIMASPWQPAGPALETMLAGSPSVWHCSCLALHMDRQETAWDRRRLGASVQGLREPVPLRPQLSPTAKGHLMPLSPVMQAG